MAAPLPPSWSLTLLRASDGSQVGKTVLPARIFPTVVDNTVYQCLPDDTVIAMRLSDGALEWRSSVAGAAAQTYPSCSVLSEADGVVFVSRLAASDAAAGQMSQLLALSATNGKMLWRYATVTPEPFAVGDGLVVLGEGRRSVPTSLVALWISDGTIAWRHTGIPPEPAFQGYFQNRTVVISGGLALVGGGGPTLWALRTDNGSVAWQITEDYHNIQAIGVVNSTVFVSSTFGGSGSIYNLVLPAFTDTNSYFSALRASDGAQYWRTPLSAGGGVVMGGA
jgi:outer membrane protein assembly factor BamB